MDILLKPACPHGTIKAIASKSVAHRLLLCAAFSDKPSRIRCEETNADILATVRCLNSLGASILRENEYFSVTPVSEVKRGCTADCGESGSTLRFLVPVVCALGADTSFLMRGRLPERPLSPLREELEKHGASISPHGSNPLICGGKLSAGNYVISGGVSSQFISGLLFALSLYEGESRLEITGNIESAPYIGMTLDALRAFGAEPVCTENSHVYIIRGRKRFGGGGNYNVEGDWSNAAFPLAAGAIAGSISVSGLNPASAQGDREILSILSRFGAECTFSGDTATVTHAPLHGIEIDASQIPDLVPVISVVAATADGDTHIYGASRLRIKESDRIMTTAAMLRSMGADVAETPDGLIIKGGRPLHGCEVSSFNDHRIAMSAAVAASACNGEIRITDAGAVAKSYPSFWEDISKLGFSPEKINL